MSFKGKEDEAEKKDRVRGHGGVYDHRKPEEAGGNRRKPEETAEIETFYSRVKESTTIIEQKRLH